MSFVRPEVKLVLARYSEVIWAGAALVIALWLVWLGGILFVMLSLPFFAAALAFGLYGVRRARFHSRQSAAPKSEGVVDLIEQELTFFDSGYGAKIALSDVTRIEIRTCEPEDGEEDMFWIISQKRAPRVEIPASAVGGDEVFDALVAFPGADYENVITASQHKGAKRFLVWEDDAARIAREKVVKLH
ncbi:MULTISPECIES: hypothetical protein [Halocynthiibacter]|uniref:Uncharacterized protein n=1 Tax=Halocynthiibacter halioticoli TaxID=2986804 RepID=A0AAE3IW23_9RHOB|nr:MULTISPECIES: hypothetical protein [Halocynthiibacter]MCV6823195.1 hypothetical protein [Halocynthiibacter halioticoli]MCW4056196.1 hypothetical protein [Halocynthiibacter sp. SDUM655004]